MLTARNKERASARKSPAVVSDRDHAQEIACYATRADDHAGLIAAHADEWDELEVACCPLERAAHLMQVSEQEAAFYMKLARERIAAREKNAHSWRRRPSLSEALLIWGTKGIMQTKSRTRYERSFPIPQAPA